MTEKFQLKSDEKPAQHRLDLPRASGAANGSGRTTRRKDTARLVWESKPKRPPSPRDIEFQTAEIVLPNPARDEATLPFVGRDLVNREIDRKGINRLIWGDNLLAMQALVATGYEGAIDAIYIDPPFFSNEDYNLELKIDVTSLGELDRQPSVVELLGYRDTWEGNRDSFLDMMFPRLQLMRRLLSDRGTLFIHMDYHLGHYIKVLADEVFGLSAFRNEIIWKNQTPSGRKAFAKQFPFTHQVIYWYSKNDEFKYRAQFKPYSDEYIQQRFTGEDERGRYKDYELESSSAEKIAQLEADGRIFRTPTGKIRVKQYLHEAQGVPIDSIWADIPSVNSQAYEANGFKTQKPEQLLDRIIRAATDEGDVVADFFCGSGTTIASAERLGRRWLACDFGKRGIQVTRARLVQLDARPFLIENIGNYQREMIYLQGGRIGEMQRIILKLYGADPHRHHRDLGVRSTDGEVELVYVGYPDRPTTAKKALELARQAQSLDGSGYKRLVLLAWDYDYDFDSAWNATKEKAEGVEVLRKLIPPDVYDYLKKAKDEEQIEKLADKIQFHEKPYLKLATPKLQGDQVTIGIERYTIFDFPVKKEEDRKKLRELAKDNFAVLIDYWAIDWDYDGQTFRSRWQAIRGNGKRAKVVPITATETLPKKPGRTIAVRVVDIFGNDAAGTVKL